MRDQLTVRQTIRLMRAFIIAGTANEAAMANNALEALRVSERSQLQLEFSRRTDSDA
ncbi:MAG: hypothetical protein ACREIA_24520 [Opitutaceae bacterium]